MNEIVRRRVLRLDNYKCQAWGCTCVSHLQVHHIIPRNLGGDAPENLISLCNKHHNEITEGKVTNYEMLKKIIKKPNFRWRYAFDWHETKEKIKRIK